MGIWFKEVNLWYKSFFYKSLMISRYNGLVHKKTVGVEAVADGKGVTLVTKRVKRKLIIK